MYINNKGKLEQKGSPYGFMWRIEKSLNSKIEIVFVVFSLLNIYIIYYIYYNICIMLYMTD